MVGARRLGSEPVGRRGVGGLPLIGPDLAIGTELVVAQGFHPAYPGIPWAVQHLQGQFIGFKAGWAGGLLAPAYHRGFKAEGWARWGLERGDLAIRIGRVVGHGLQGVAQEGCSNGLGVEGPIAHDLSGPRPGKAHRVSQPIAAHLPAAFKPARVGEIAGARPLEGGRQAPAGPGPCPIRQRCGPGGSHRGQQSDDQPQNGHRPCPGWRQDCHHYLGDQCRIPCFGNSIIT